MSKFVARERAKFKGLSGPVNIPWGSVLDEQDGLIFWRGQAVCLTTSQNAYDFFSSDDDGQGRLRGKLVAAIKKKLEKRDSGYQARWDKVLKSNADKNPCAKNGVNDGSIIYPILTNPIL